MGEESTTPTGLHANVKRGAQLLDTHRPGWAVAIQPDLLRMQDCAQCVLGQVYGNYIVGFKALEDLLDAASFSASFYGFDLFVVTSAASSAAVMKDPRWNMLRDYWLEEVATRVTLHNAKASRVFERFDRLDAAAVREELIGV